MKKYWKYTIFKNGKFREKTCKMFLLKLINELINMFLLRTENEMNFLTMISGMGRWVLLQFHWAQSTSYTCWCHIAPSQKVTPIPAEAQRHLKLCLKAHWTPCISCICIFKGTSEVRTKLLLYKDMCKAKGTVELRNSWNIHSLFSLFTFFFLNSEAWIAREKVLAVFSQLKFISSEISKL